MVSASVAWRCDAPNGPSKRSLSPLPTPVCQTEPCERPSKVTVPIITAMTATVPGSGSSRASPLSSGRRTSSPMRPKSPK